MGTRSITIIMDGDIELCVMYRQYDGYIEPGVGHAYELGEFLKDAECVNGIPIGSDQKGTRLFNGAGCMAASLFAHFKTGPGGIYLEPAGTRGVGEDYQYLVQWRSEGQPVGVAAIETAWEDGEADKLLWAGTAPDFAKWVATDPLAGADEEEGVAA